MSGASRRWLIGAAVALSAVGGCRGEPGGEREQMADHGATVDSMRETATARTHGTGGDSAGTTLRTPPLLPALEQHLQRMRSDPAASAENMTSYKFMLADVADAMTEDLSRISTLDTAGFVQLRDRVVDEVGGGAGGSGTLKPEDFPQHIARVEQLLATYRRLSSPGATPER
jgi:hypothetical protein